MEPSDFNRISFPRADFGGWSYDVFICPKCSALVANPGVHIDSVHPET